MFENFLRLPGAQSNKSNQPTQTSARVQNPPNLRMQCSSALYSSQTQANKLASKSNQRNSLNYDFRRGIKPWYQDEDHLITEIIAALIAPKAGLNFYTTCIYRTWQDCVTFIF